MQIINRSNTKGNLNLYVKRGNKQILQHKYGEVPVSVVDLFIELTGAKDFWRAQHCKRYKEWFLKYPDWCECYEIYTAGINANPMYWRLDGYIKTKNWAKQIGWDLFHCKGVFSGENRILSVR